LFIKILVLTTEKVKLFYLHIQKKKAGMPSCRPSPGINHVELTAQQEFIPQVPPEKDAPPDEPKEEKEEKLEKDDMSLSTLDEPHCVHLVSFSVEPMDCSSENCVPQSLHLYS